MAALGGTAAFNLAAFVRANRAARASERSSALKRPGAAEGRLAAGGTLMMNPNRASSVAVVRRRGKVPPASPPSSTPTLSGLGLGLSWRLSSTCYGRSSPHAAVCAALASRCMCIYRLAVNVKTCRG